MKKSEGRFAERFSLLFPKLDSVWSNVSYNSSSEAKWRAWRRICDPGHFSTYFRLTLSADVLSKKVLQEFFQNISNEESSKRFFRERASVVRKDGRSEVPLILDDLIGSSDRISKEQANVLLCALFQIADELDLERDEERGFSGLGTNLIRLGWVFNELVRDRLPQSERSTLLLEILPRASLGWMVSLVSRLHREHYSRQNDQLVDLDQRIVNEATLSELQSRTLRRLREASQSGELLFTRRIVYILYRWRELSNDAQEVRRWTDSQLSDDNFVISLASAFISTAVITTSNESREEPRVQLDGSTETILDVQRFRKRLDEIEAKNLTADTRGMFSRFREGMRNSEAEWRRGNSPDQPTPETRHGGVGQ